jgi:hypothetical protein
VTALPEFDRGFGAKQFRSAGINEAALSHQYPHGFAPC